MINDEWLKKTNMLLRERGVEPRQRAFEAIRLYAEENKTSVSLTSDLAETIFNWFYSHTKESSHQMGALYESVYFFDSSFWKIEIPIIYGQVELNALSSLKDMPDVLKDDLMKNPKTAWDYTIFWADCVDYGLGIEDLRNNRELDQFGLQLLFAGDQELRTAVALLNQARPQERALLVCRMATELFLKSYCALKGKMSESDAKSIGHNLSKGFDQFIKISGLDKWKPIKEDLSIYPPIHERYSEHLNDLKTLWKGFTIAQSFGALNVRSHTDRKIIEQVIANK